MTQDARERAYEAWREREESGWYVDDPDINFKAGWDARGLEDEQRIAALMAALREADDNIFCECVLEGMADGKAEWTICGPHVAIRRALAGEEYS